MPRSNMPVVAAVVEATAKRSALPKDATPYLDQTMEEGQGDDLTSIPQVDTAKIAQVSLRQTTMAVDLCAAPGR